VEDGECATRLREWEVDWFREEILVQFKQLLEDVLRWWNYLQLCEDSVSMFRTLSERNIVRDSSGYIQSNIPSKSLLYIFVTH
jgi:hypothetical protein